MNEELKKRLEKLEEQGHDDEFLAGFKVGFEEGRINVMDEHGILYGEDAKNFIEDIERNNKRAEEIRNGAELTPEEKEWRDSLLQVRGIVERSEMEAKLSPEDKAMLDHVRKVMKKVAQTSYFHCPQCGEPAHDDHFGYNPPVPECDKCGHYCNWQNPEEEFSGLKAKYNEIFEKQKTRKEEWEGNKNVKIEPPIDWYAFGLFDGGKPELIELYRKTELCRKLLEELRKEENKNAISKT
jgi:RNA polymerase-binding transcription factor DksA